MVKPYGKKRGRKSGALLVKNGLLTIALGASMLTASAVLGAASPIKAAVSTALSMPGWWAIGTGIALILAQALFFRRSSALESSPREPARVVAGLGPDAIRAMIDQAERAFALSQIDPSADGEATKAEQPVPTAGKAPGAP